MMRNVVSSSNLFQVTIGFSVSCGGDVLSKGVS